MTLNVCHAMVLYIPVWRPQVLHSEDDEIPDLISEEDWATYALMEHLHLLYDVSFAFNMSFVRSNRCAGLVAVEPGNELWFHDCPTVDPLPSQYDYSCRSRCNCPCHETQPYKAKFAALTFFTVVDSDFTVWEPDFTVVDSDFTVWEPDTALPKTLSQINEDGDSDTDNSGTDDSDMDNKAMDVDTHATAIDFVVEEAIDVAIGVGIAEAVESIEMVETVVGRKCDFCSVDLGPEAPVPCRFFPCEECSCVQCESCCYEKHLAMSRHKVEEWDTTQRIWVPRCLSESGLQNKYQMNCGSCCAILAHAGAPMPTGMLACAQCSNSLLCSTCCLEDHAVKPLHGLKWNGRCWDMRALKEVGFVYQMGHSGRVCESPEVNVSTLLVLDMSARHSINLRYCMCGKFEAGLKGRWQQILDNGWQVSTLDHFGFQMWSDVFGLKKKHEQTQAFTVSCPPPLVAADAWSN
ncbi:hypothetical protein C8R44DRAFT_867164 [Mycena epipterygia]|nr:hypothetical protein C8R44DRAFT_867164 [Mycena epipterygia]